MSKVIREAFCFVSVCFYFSILVSPESGLYLEKIGSGHPTLGSPIAPSIALSLTTDKLTFFRHFDKDYLHEQYMVLGKSMNQIARERGCSRSTVGTALADLGFEIQARKELRCNKGQLAFGERLIHGQVVRCESELRTIKRMAAMKVAGASYGEIAKALNSSGVKSKNKCNGWSRPAIYKILKRFKG
ncbi:MAG: recombinase family protein [Bdellovibrionales bacterium]|nr:recombinase family protein [Bdellovibrionales bacterium]